MDGLESAGEDRKASKAPSRIKGWAFSLSLLLSTSLGGQAALASTRHHHHIATHRRHHVTETSASATHHNTVRLASYSEHHRLRHEHIYYTSEHYRSGHERHQHELHYASYHHYRHLHYRYASAEYRHSYLQCVPYAREISHIDLTGDAFLWWAEAAGRYARGSTPQEGAVLNFRAIGRMPLGHVAVVTDVIDSRTILTTQANWIRGTITNDVTMQDVSPNNDWSEVEVELGDSSKWGAPYPTYGFIYNQPDNGSVIATAAQGNEVAEAPRAVPIETDAPDRELQ